ncbi:FtsW/RodA/SpoVE family cell cycle protein [Oscillospiraceae bacterium WX1]
MKKKMDAVIRYMREADMLLLALCVISTVYGIILIDSAVRSTGSFSNVITQIISLVIGIALFVLFSLLDVDVMADKSKILYVLSLLFISTLFIWGVEGGTGNRAWLRFGSFGIQPAEVVKIPFTIIMAKMISNFKERRTLNATMPLLQIMAVFGVMFLFIIVSSQDLGSALVYFFILFMMLFIAGLDFRWMIIGGGLLAAFIPLAWNFFLSAYQKARILAPYDPTIDPSGLTVNWQSSQSKIAIAAGNFLGQGLFNGPMTQSGAVPKQYTDFVFSVAGEELGFLGSLAIIILLMAIIIRCVYVGIRSNNTIGLLVCFGLAAMLLFQTLENIGMCLGLTPVIGLTLPFFSSGGSSIVTMFAAMGIISGIKMRPKPTRFRGLDNY